MFEPQRFNLQLFANGEEKTEEPTPKRREDVRRKGQAARSADLNAAVGLLAVIVFLFFMRENFVLNLENFLAFIFRESAAFAVNMHNLEHLALLSVSFFLKFMAPVFLISLAAGLLINFAQVGFMFSLETLKPKLEKINPLEGFKRMFSKKALMELGKSLIKIFLVGAVSYYLVKLNFLDLLFIIDMPLEQGFMKVLLLLFIVSMGAIVVFIPVAIGDYIFQRYEFRQQLKMTRHEVKEEGRQTEGDPQIKAKLREKRRQMAMQRMMASVPEATVVVTNPVKIAVALDYDYSQENTEAPRVVAKGAGDIAERIKKVAKENEVPVIENKPVAQFLYKNVDIGEEIPSELYQAVAEILALLYRMGKNKI